MKKLCDCKLDNKLYQPTENTLFCEKYLKNPLFYKIDKFWKLHISKFYLVKTLNNISNYEFIDCLNPKEELTKIYNNFNFYPGIFQHTFTHKDKKECITFKIKDNIIVKTVHEWYQYFKETNDFSIDNI